MGVTRYEDISQANVKVLFEDGEEAQFGTGAPSSIFWETEDVNANYLAVELPTGGAVDVPVLAIGIGIDGVDLGIFNGITQPTFAVLDADRDTALLLDYSADDQARIRTIGTTRTLTVVPTGNLVLDPAGDLEVTEPIEFTVGIAVTATNYEMARNADTPNQLQLNVPTGAGFELSVNDVAEFTLSAAAVDFKSNSITTTGGGSLTGTWSDLGVVTTVDINGGTIDGATVGASSATTIIGTTIDATTDFTIGATVITDGVLTDAGGFQMAAALDMATNAISNIGAVGNDFGASQLDLAAAYTILGANVLNINTTAGALTLAPNTVVSAAKPLQWSAGTAATAAAYEITRNADGTNLLQLNVPTGASFELSVNDVVQMSLSVTAVNFQDNSITTTGGGSLTGTWSDMGVVTTVDINGGTIDGATIGASSATTIIGTTIDATTDFTIGATVITDGVLTDAGGFQIAATLDMSSNTIIGVGNAGSSLTGTAWTLSAANATSNSTLLIANTSSGAGAYHAILEASVSGTGGDPQTRWTTPAGTWYMGVDNDGADFLKIGSGTVIGTESLMWFDSRTVPNIYMITLVPAPATITIASGASNVFGAVSVRSQTVNYTGATQVTGLEAWVGLAGPTFVSDTATLTIDKATTLLVSGPVESTNVLLVDSSTVRIRATGGTPTNQMAIGIEAISGGTSRNDNIMVGLPTTGTTWTSTADHNIFAVAASELPTWGWDDSETAWTTNVGIRFSADVDFLPMTDGEGDIGNASFRWQLVRAVTITGGDLGWEERTDYYTDKPFVPDDILVMAVRSIDGENGTLTVPTTFETALSRSEQINDIRGQISDLAAKLEELERMI